MASPKASAMSGAICSNSLSEMINNPPDPFLKTSETTEISRRKYSSSDSFDSTKKADVEGGGEAEDAAKNGS